MKGFSARLVNFPNSLSEAIRGTAIPRASEHLNFSNFLVLQLRQILEFWIKSRTRYDIWTQEIM